MSNEIPLEASRAALEGRGILLTGAAGSLGRELAIACARAGPRELWLLDRSEASLVDLLRVLEGEGLVATPVLGDVCDPRLLDSLFERSAIEVVFHAAAVKHVAFLEQQPLEAIRVNAVGTHALLRAARAGGARRFVLVSTDKAVDPTSVLGATKRAAELGVLGLEPSTLECVGVRLGNVLGSRGSVIPLFDAQIEAGGPVTLTDPDAARYLISIEDAVALLLAASWLGEPGELLVPDLGEPVPVRELARRRMRAAAREVPISVIGLRPGEKRIEALASADEPLEPTAVPGVRRVKGLLADGRSLASAIDELERCVARRDAAGAVARLRALVPGWSPSSALLAAAAEDGPRPP